MKTGTQLGPYRIAALVGEGGMGQVYRAVDTRLDRSVAVKVLPAHLSSNPQLRERFEREARAISSLSHPHICTLYDVGRDNGTDYLVMEYLEGESLADRLARGPLPLKEALRYGVEIAEALATAHRHGIVHRDLKPGNVMITKSGAKLLDFGLARTAGATVFAPDAPTEVHKPLTAEGTLLGTFQYMAPEQLEGAEADARTDIFALGLLLYEMLSGRRAFDGKTRTSLIAAIVAAEPQSIRTLQPLAPPLLEHVLSKCLAKEPDARWQSAHDVAGELRWIRDDPSAGATRAAAPGRPRVAAIAIGLLIAGLIAGFAAATYRARSQPKPLILAAIVPPDGASFRPSGGDDPDVAVISPDGRTVAFTAFDGAGRKLLWLRRLSDRDARPLPGTDGARQPFWSAAGDAIAFFAHGKLKRVALDGSPPLTICDVGSHPLGGAWNEAGVILFSPSSGAPIHQVPASGGRSVAVTTLDSATGETTHRWARFLPDGRTFVYLAASHNLPVSTEVNAIYATRLGASERTLILRVRSNVDYADGHLLFARDDTLYAQPFAADDLKLRGEAVAIASNVHRQTDAFLSFFSASAAGPLVYVTSGGTSRSELVWLDGEGQQTELLHERAEQGDTIADAITERAVTLSPDGKTLALTREDASDGLDVWLHDLERGARTRFTRGGTAADPVWSSDGRSIFYVGPRNDIFLRNADGTGEPQRLWQLTATWGGPTAASADGRYLSIWTFDAKTTGRYDAFVLPLTGDAKLIPLAATTAAEMPIGFSRDGQWALYQSDESGAGEIYVASLPDAKVRRQISINGATTAMWAGPREIWYRRPDGTWVATTLDDHGDGPPAVSPPRPLFRNPAIVHLIGRDFKDRLVAIRERTDEKQQHMILASDWRGLMAGRGK